MSITVNYKGQDIATSVGDALTLLTAGKYLEADVLLSASGGDGIAEYVGEAVGVASGQYGTFDVSNSGIDFDASGYYVFLPKQAEINATARNPRFCAFVSSSNSSAYRYYFLRIFYQGQPSGVQKNNTQIAEGGIQPMFDGASNMRMLNNCVYSVYKINI